MKASYYNKCLSLLREINRQFPSYNMGKHLSTALDGHDLWGMSDMEMFNALTIYKAELEFDIPHSSDDIDRIVEEGMHLGTILEDNGEEDNIY